MCGIIKLVQIWVKNKHFCRNIALFYITIAIRLFHYVWLYISKSRNNVLIQNDLFMLKENVYGHCLQTTF